MSLYKRFRGHEPSPEALLKERDYYKSQYEFYFRTEAMFRFFLSKENDHQPPKNRNAFDPKGIIAGSFSLAK
jgi:hypothetical protein